MICLRIFSPLQSFLPKLSQPRVQRISDAWSSFQATAPQWDNLNPVFYIGSQNFSIGLSSMPIEVTCLLIHSLLAAFLSLPCLISWLLLWVFPGTTSQINYLHLDICTGSPSGGTQAKIIVVETECRKQILRIEFWNGITSLPSQKAVRTPQCDKPWHDVLPELKC